MNPFRRDTAMTPALYLLLFTIIHIPFQHLYAWGQVVSYVLFASIWVVAYLWNEWTWRKDDKEGDTNANK